MSVPAKPSFDVSRFTSDDVESAHVAQSVEHVLGKDEVTSSNLVVGSKEEFRIPDVGIRICF
jgi:hypothetical protein